MKRLLLLLALVMPLVILSGCSKNDSSFAGTHWIYSGSYSLGGSVFNEIHELIFTSNNVTHTWKATEGGMQIDYGQTEAPYFKDGNTFSTTLTYKGASYKLSGEISSNKLYVDYNGVEFHTFTKR